MSADDYHQGYYEVAGRLEDGLSDLEGLRASILQEIDENLNTDDKLLRHLDFIHDLIVSLQAVVGKLRKSRANV
jgi:hypothetical protein